MGSKGYLLVVQISVLIALWKAAKLESICSRSRHTVCRKPVKTFYVERKVEGVSSPHSSGVACGSSALGLNSQPH